MNTTVTMHLKIHGQLGVGVFPKWMCHRAQRLDLTGWVTTHSQEYIEVTVCGNEVLVDAFEIACSLGPCSVQVDSIDARQIEPTGSSDQFLELRTENTL